MIILDANEVMGRGFTLPGVKIEEMLKARDAARRENVATNEKGGDTWDKP